MKFWILLTQAIKARRMQWLIYSALGFGFLLLYVSVYPSIQEQAASYNDIFKTLPKGLTTAFNITNDEPTLMGYLSSKHFGLAWLLLVIFFAVSHGSYSISKEIESKTMGFLLSRPISRSTLYLSRLTAGIIGLVVLVFMTAIVVWPMARVAHYEISGVDVLLVGLSGLLFGVAVLCMAMMFSAWSSAGGRVSALVAGVLLTMYVLFIVASLAPSLESLRYVSIFHYFSPGEIVKTGTIPYSSILMFMGMSVCSALIGLFVFKRREIQV